jgi:hypothetical protein
MFTYDIYRLIDQFMQIFDVFMLVLNFTVRTIVLASITTFFISCLHLLLTLLSAIPSHTPRTQCDVDISLNYVIKNRLALFPLQLKMEWHYIIHG